jgi:hypothetical protein
MQQATGRYAKYCEKESGLGKATDELVEGAFLEMKTTWVCPEVADAKKCYSYLGRLH